MIRHYYFIGIGGIGMSGIAKILLAKGDKISGSDLKENNETVALSNAGATVYIGQEEPHITPDIDRVVVTSAIPSNNADLIKAKELGLTIFSRSEMLNKVITKSKAIAVTGTHGKTTTSSMLSTALIMADMDPTVLVGAEISEIGSNARLGLGDYSVAEVCEYQRAFLDIHPFGAIITNIDSDHLDCYKDISDIKSAFTKFLGQVDPTGFLTYCIDDSNTSDIATSYSGKKLSYGENENATYQIRGIHISETNSIFEVFKDGALFYKYELAVPGKHNILNAVAVIATSDYVGADKEKVATALLSFKGAERRFQLKGDYKGSTIIDDYAHHPTEIKATLRAARDCYPESRIVAVFQPHQHSRTKLLMNEFAESFSDANIVILPEIYTVRDSKEDIQSVSSSKLAELINTTSTGKASFTGSLENTEVYLDGIIKENDIVLTIGAGPVNTVGEHLLQN